MNDGFEVAVILGELNGTIQHDIKWYSTPKSTLTVADGKGTVPTENRQSLHSKKGEQEWV